MTIRYFVYDIRGQLEEFVASFADRADAVDFGQRKFGEHAYVTDVAHHDKIKLGVAKKVRRR
jgi:collagenase-like PrtC family protease